MAVKDYLNEVREYFGFTLDKKDTPARMQPVVPSPVPPENEDGGFTMETGGVIRYFWNIDQVFRTEDDLILKYRDISTYPEADAAIEEICSDSIVNDEEEPPVKINMDELEFSDNVKDKIIKEFDCILELLRFNLEGHDLFKKWYVDGRLYFHIIKDPKNDKCGIVELRPISPLDIKKVVELERKRDVKTNVDIVVGEKEYYVYKQDNKAGNVGIGTGSFASTYDTGIILSPDSVVYVHSGKNDDKAKIILGYLHNAVKPINMLRMLEDSLVIYRLARAPERRAIYIDVANLPKTKAEQYIKSLMTKYRNRMAYDMTTGTMKEQVNHMSMLEDYWLPRRDGGRGTEVQTLQGGQTLGQIDDITYLLQRVYRALNVPLTRLQSETVFTSGRSAEITRDEVKFSKYINRLRNRFSQLFYKLLRVQLILKGIINEEDWETIRAGTTFDFTQDSYYAELKDSEILMGRLSALQLIEPYIGIHYSKEWVQANVLHLTEEEVKEMKSQIKKEKDELIEDAKFKMMMMSGGVDPAEMMQQQMGMQDPNAMGGPPQPPFNQGGLQPQDQYGTSSPTPGIKNAEGEEEDEGQ